MWLQFLKRAVFAAAGGALACGLAMLSVFGGQAEVRAQQGDISPQAVLYNQIEVPNQKGVSSTRVSGAFPTYTQGADDFRVSGPEWFIISSVEVRGSVAGGAPHSVLVEFYNTLNNLPGNLLYSQAASVGGTGGDFVLTLPTPAVLRPSGTPYWLSVQSQSTNITVLWFWGTRSQVASSNPAAYKTATLPDCTNVWASRNTCAAVAGAGPDNQFAISGNTFIPTAFVYLPLIRR